jgi:hypothetical protein
MSSGEIAIAIATGASPTPIGATVGSDARVAP